MKTVRPSLMMILDLDERVATHELRLEVDRSYGYVGSTIIRTHAGDADAAPSNTIRVMPKLGTRKYLDASIPEAEELWDEVMESWLYNTFHKLFNHTQIFNRRQREIGNDELAFEWVNVELENGALIVRMHLDSNSAALPESSRMVSEVRAALNAGVLGEDVTMVSMPTASSFAAQTEEGLAAKAERLAAEEARKAAEAEQARKAAEEAEAEAAEKFLESPELMDDEAQEESDEEDAVSEQEDLFELPEADFTVDYTLWTIHYGGGETRDYDSVAQSFIG